MTSNRHDRVNDGKLHPPDLEPVVNRDRCLTETFWDREFELTRCLENKNCRYKQYYLHMTICTCPLS